MLNKYFNEMPHSIWGISHPAGLDALRAQPPGCEYVVRDETNAHGFQHTLLCGFPHFAETVTGKRVCHGHAQHVEQNGRVLLVFRPALKDCAKGEYWCKRVSVAEKTSFCSYHRCHEPNCEAEATVACQSGFCKDHETKENPSFP